MDGNSCAADRVRETRTRSARVDAGRACALVALACAASACQAAGRERPPDLRFPMLRGSEPGESTTWLRFSVGYLDRLSADDDPIADGSAWGLDGGVDLAQTVLTPSFELGAGFTAANVTEPAIDDLKLWRAFTGMRATWYADGWRPYARGGGFARWTTDDVDEPFDPSAAGAYLGIGIDWPSIRGLWIGPNVTWFHAFGEDAPGGDGDEIVYALSATFRL